LLFDPVVQNNFSVFLHFVMFILLGETFVTCDISQNRKYLVAMIPRDVAARDGLGELGKRGHRDDVTVSVKRRKRNKDPNSK